VAFVGRFRFLQGGERAREQAGIVDGDRHLIGQRAQYGQILVAESGHLAGLQVQCAQHAAADLQGQGHL
jgi:hypothetical protein